MIASKTLSILLEKYQKVYTKWTGIVCVRAKSSSEPKIKTYSHTVLFPKTNFPARPSSDRNEEIHKSARFPELYQWQREHLKGKEFILHDGPPYANGDLHMGHAVNKIIKDISNRSHILQGNRIHYVPGWDCHGLPIELKALQKAKKTSKNQSSNNSIAKSTSKNYLLNNTAEISTSKNQLFNNTVEKSTYKNQLSKDTVEKSTSNNQLLNDPVEIRNIARNFALETVEKQKESFRSWGVMADWDEQCYLTLNKDYVKNQLRYFYKMYQNGYVFRALKPVYWSPSSKTALAEAELEYDPQFKSKQVYVRFPIDNPPQILKDLAINKPISALIWTTTPWTLVANKAICYSPELKYSVVSLENDLYVVASELVGQLTTIVGSFATVFEFDGHHLVNTTYYNKLTCKTLPFLPASHVTSAKGTGLVHTAPAHGPDDFLVALNHNIHVDCKVDEAGLYADLDAELNGLPVLTAGQDAVIKRLADDVLYKGVYTHSYPLDWRTKQPVILRASQQWFIDTAKLKDKALKALDGVTMLPPTTADKSRQSFRAQLEKRPYWCISRQRAWGVPIPALYCKDDVIVDENVIEKLCYLIDEQGTDVWWTCDVKQLLADREGVEKGKDIMDIWLDSGLSWTTLDGHTAHLYSEGVDQLTGWFQTSLLTSIALNGQAPYESIFVHGFVVDENKRKMSKSIGNVIDPTDIIRGFGVDTLRWWVASHATQHSQIVISKKLLQDCQSEVIRIRNIFKYLLGVINDLDKTSVEQKMTLNLNYFDQYMISECQQFLGQIFDHYNNLRYNHAAQLILYFISNQVSGLYCHCVKDRLYCSPKNSHERFSAQFVIHIIFVSLSKALGPILPHLIEESWQYHPLFEKPFYFTENIPVLTASVDNTIMDTMLDIKRDICSLAKNENLKKFSAKIALDSDLYDKLNFTNIRDGFNDSVLCEILEMSCVSLEAKNIDKWEIKLEESVKSQCMRCRKYNALENNDKCLRCENVLLYEML